MRLSLLLEYDKIELVRRCKPSSGCPPEKAGTPAHWSKGELVMGKVIISADSTCDIGPELQKRFNVQLLNWRILLDDKEYLDNVSITPDDLYSAWRERGALPKSTGATCEEYKAHFQPLIDQGYEIVHIGLGSGISCSYQNAVQAARETGHVIAVDSQNLSTGFGLLVLEAAELAAKGCSAEEIAKRVEELRPRSHASFLLDTLEFMKAGGRCSSLAAFGASILQLKPCIEVDNRDGSRMHVGKKYRGKMEQCLLQYVRNKLDGRTDLDLRRVFVTHSGSPESDIRAVCREVARCANFKEILVTRASCTISAHCGPRTLGVLFLTK